MDDRLLTRERIRAFMEWSRGERHGCPNISAIRACATIEALARDLRLATALLLAGDGDKPLATPAEQKRRAGEIVARWAGTGHLEER